MTTVEIPWAYLNGNGPAASPGVVVIRPGSSFASLIALASMASTTLVSVRFDYAALGGQSPKVVFNGSSTVVDRDGGVDAAGWTNGPAGPQTAWTPSWSLPPGVIPSFLVQNSSATGELRVGISGLRIVGSDAPGERTLWEEVSVGTTTAGSLVPRWHLSQDNGRWESSE